MSINWNDIEVERLRLQPGDKIILSTTEAVGPHGAEDIKARAEQRFPGHEIIVLDRLTMQIVEEPAT